MSDAPQGHGAWGTGRGALLQDKLQRVQQRLATFDRVVIAFSGGVDSTLLAHIAREVLGKDNVFAVTADSPSLSREDLTEAKRLAAQLDLQHRVIATKEVTNPLYRRNTPTRCYVCKQELFEELDELARAQHIAVILYGAIGDDLLAERPGQHAAVERGVLAPLQEVGLEKWEVRELARTLGVPNWDRPQNACLSSRIPHGEEVTEQKLRQIEAAEALLRARGFRQVRVRHLGRCARIEVTPSEVSRFEEAALRLEVIAGFLALGFETVSVDRAGYRPGGADTRRVDEWVLQAGVPAKQEVSTCGI